MSEPYLLFASALLILFSLIGFIAIFFTTSGTFIILIGALLFSVMTRFLILGPWTLAGLFLFYLIGEFLEYVLVMFGTRRFGASKAAAWGALIGALLGAIVGMMMAGVGIIPGTLLGIFFGAFAAEMGHRRDFKKSLHAGLGGLAGRMVSIAAKVVIAIAMFSLILLRFLHYSANA